MITKNNVDCYWIDISNPFDRGEVVGGFGYIRYKDETRNKLVTMSKAELLKRKPSTAAANFGVEKKISGKMVKRLEQKLLKDGKKKCFIKQW